MGKLVKALRELDEAIYQTATEIINTVMEAVQAEDKNGDV